MRYGFVFVIGAALVGLGAASATAQPPRAGASPPPFSPYLNLVRPGVSPTLNYYGLVRPEMQARQSLLSLQSQVGTNSQAINDLASGGPLPATGKSVGFMNYGRYFQNFNSGGGSSTGGSSFGTIGGSASSAARSPAAAPRR